MTAARRTLLAALALALVAAPAAVARGLHTEPVIPPLTGAVGEHVREIADAGEALGNHADVFAKVGDSITESGSFLADLACEQPAWGRWAALAATREHFGRRTFPAAYASVWCDRANSFSRASAVAVTGWDAGDALAPLGDPPAGCNGLSALECEYRLIRPAVALVMYGTNDVEHFTQRAYAANLTEIVARSVEAGVVPVLSTIPPRLDKPRQNRRATRFNRRVIRVARESSVPLWNYWRALRDERMVHSGISADGIHPNLYGGCAEPIGCAAFDFTRAGLRYGYNQRNLGALRVLERVRAALVVARRKAPARPRRSHSRSSQLRSEPPRPTPVGPDGPRSSTSASSSTIADASTTSLPSGLLTPARSSSARPRAPIPGSSSLDRRQPSAIDPAASAMRLICDAVAVSDSPRASRLICAAARGGRRESLGSARSPSFPEA